MRLRRSLMALNLKNAGDLCDRERERERDIGISKDESRATRSFDSVPRAELRNVFSPRGITVSFDLRFSLQLRLQLRQEREILGPFCATESETRFRIAVPFGVWANGRERQKRGISEKSNAPGRVLRQANRAIRSTRAMLKCA